MIKIDFRNAPELRAYLRDLPRSVKRIGAEAAGEEMRRAASGDRPSPGIYPARISRYKRTYTLKRGWRKVVRGAYTRVVNDVPYAGYVMGVGPRKEQRQAWMHVGLWDTVSKVLTDNQDRAMAVAVGAVQAYIENTAPRFRHAYMPGDEVGV